MGEFLGIILGAFLTGFLSSTLALGPVTFLVFRNALIGKYGRGVAMIFGSSLMEAIYCATALTLVSTVLSYNHKIQIFSRAVSFFLFLIIGIYLLKTNLDREISSGVKEASKGEKSKSFLAGFVLVALNPTIILTWSAAITVLYSLKIVAISTFLDIVVFALFAAIGTICGGLSMIFLIKIYKINFSRQSIKVILKLFGIILIVLSIHSLIKIFLK